MSEFEKLCGADLPIFFAAESLAFVCCPVLARHQPEKDGKEYRYFNVVENRLLRSGKTGWIGTIDMRCEAT